jgi:TRAP-type mannitol/chloroaromatic compound transport system substrate-binding protein
MPAKAGTSLRPAERRFSSGHAAEPQRRIRIKRRSFIKGAGGGVVATATAASSLPAPAMRELKMVTTWPKNFPGLGTAAERIAQRITAASEGKLTVKVFAAGELVPPFESFDVVLQGTAEMYHAAEYYWRGKSKAFNFFAPCPSA